MELLAAVHHRLDAVHVAGEHGDDDPTVRPLEQLVEGGCHFLFRHGVARALGVGGIAQQGQHALLPQLGQAAQVDGRAVHGGVVHLEIAGVDDGAHRGFDRQGACPRDGVVHVDELHGEAARMDHVAFGDHVQRSNVLQPVLLQLVLAQRQRQFRAVDRGGQVAQHVGHRADVVLVAVGDEIAPDLLPVVLQVTGIGNDEVHPGHILPGKNAAEVDHDDVILIFKYRQVLADFAKAAQRYDLQFRRFVFSGQAITSFGKIFDILYVARLRRTHGSLFRPCSTAQHTKISIAQFPIKSQQGGCFYRKLCVNIMPFIRFYPHDIDLFCSPIYNTVNGGSGCVTAPREFQTKEKTR